MFAASGVLHKTAHLDNLYIALNERRYSAASCSTSGRGGHASVPTPVWLPGRVSCSRSEARWWHSHATTGSKWTCAASSSSAPKETLLQSQYVTDETVEQDRSQEEQDSSQQQGSRQNHKARAILKASKSVCRPVPERQRPLSEYMALPASQYSVLDAKKIERIDEDTFRCYVGGLHFFNFVIEPVLTVSVIVGDRGPTVKLLSTKLEGSKAAQAANDRFDATMTNVVRWGLADDGQTTQLRSDTSIEVTLEVPRLFSMVPVSAIERSGSAVMQRVLNTMVPRFLAQLEADYVLWASGDTSRKPVGTGEL